MSRYINTEDFRKRIDHYPPEIRNVAKKELRYTQTADVVEVRHSKWVKMSDKDGVYWACNECGEDIPRIAYYNPQFDLFPRLESIDRTNYCPHCGAKMEMEGCRK